MTRRNNEIRSRLAHLFNGASDYSGGCTPHQREAAHYESGRKDGLAQALELVDTLLRDEEIAATEQRPRARVPLH